MIPEKRVMAALLVMLLMVVSLDLQARAERLEDPQLRERFDRLAEELRCPKCQNESIASSGAPIARDMRQRVRKLLREGYSDQTILDEMVARFGDFVRYRPPVEPRTWVLWFGPFVAIGVGIAAALVLVLRARGRNQVGGAGQLSEDERRRAEKWLSDE